MVRLGFDLVVANSQELVEFCERLEFDEDLNQKPEAMPKSARVAVKWDSYAQPKSFRGGQSKRLKTNDLAHGSAYDPSNTVPCMASTVMI